MYILVRSSVPDDRVKYALVPCSDLQERERERQEREREHRQLQAKANLIVLVISYFCIAIPLALLCIFLTCYARVL
jgi:hypothetical protein